MYQNSRSTISAAAIDLIPRATALKALPATQPAARPEAEPAPAKPVAPAKPLVPGASSPSVSEPLQTKAEFSSRISVSAMRAKNTKIEGGDFDDKRDRISFTIKLANADPNRPFPGLNLEFYIFGQSLVDQKAFKLLHKFEKSFDLKPLQEITFVTPEVVTEWDNTGAIFGAKYKGWYLFMRGADGAVLLEKSTSSFIENSAGLSKVAVGGYFNRKLEPIMVDRPNF